MSFTTIRRTVALALLVLLLVALTWVGLFIRYTASWDAQDWVHIFCLTQSILLAACAVYGPGKFVVRMSFVAAWGLTNGFVLARLNLISTQGGASLMAGAILIVTGTLSALIIFALHRWRTGASVTYGSSSTGGVSSPIHQFNLQTLLILTAAFAVTGTVARSIVTGPTDPYGTDHDILVLHAWLGFFPLLAAAPALLVVFRPSWKTAALACCCFVVVTAVDPFLLDLAAPFIFENMDMTGALTLADYLKDASIGTLLFNGQTLIATLLYAILARAAGFRMVFPDQSNDKKPNPSGHPETEAGCVQD